jgi:hypothetical protein
LEVEEIDVAVNRIRDSIDLKVDTLEKSKNALKSLSDILSNIRTDLRLDSDNKQIAITRATEELRNLLGSFVPPSDPEPQVINRGHSLACTFLF